MSLLDLLNEFRDEAEKVPETNGMKFAQQVDKANAYVGTSAMHKELRRRDFRAAAYRAIILDRMRGRFYVLRYLSDITQEESHNPGVKVAIAKIFEGYKTATLVDVLRAVELFCRNNHWKYMTEIEDIVWQMNSYLWKDTAKHTEEKKRIYDPVPELVEKWEKTLPKSVNKPVKGTYSMAEVVALFEEAIERKDVKKGLYVIALTEFKTAHKYMKDILVSSPETEEMYELMLTPLLQKNSFWSFDYETFMLHKMGLLPDMSDWIEGELYTDKELEDFAEEIQKDVGENGVPPVPLYVFDSHTREGKQVWYKQRKQILPNRPATVSDLRYAADWVSLLWRREAFKQFETLHKEWEEVELPEDLYYKALWKDVYPYDEKSVNTWWRSDWYGDQLQVSE